MNFAVCWKWTFSGEGGHNETQDKVSDREEDLKKLEKFNCFLTVSCWMDDEKLLIHELRRSVCQISHLRGNETHEATHEIQLVTAVISTTVQKRINATGKKKSGSLNLEGKKSKV